MMWKIIALKFVVIKNNELSLIMYFCNELYELVAKKNIYRLSFYIKQ